MQKLWSSDLIREKTEVHVTSSPPLPDQQNPRGHLELVCNSCRSQKAFPSKCSFKLYRVLVGSVG